MATNYNGHVLPPAFASPGTPYYVSAGAGSEVPQPVLIAPITLQANPEEGALDVPAAIQVPGADSADPVLVGGVNIVAGGNAASEDGAAGVIIYAAAGGATIMQVGDTSAGNKIQINGASGLSQVYDPKYNAAIKSTPVVNQTFTLNSAAPGTAVYQVAFTPSVSGAYMVQVDLNLYNVDTIPLISNPVIGGAGGGVNEKAGAIEWTVTSGAGEVQFLSSTFTGQELTRANELVGVAEPMDYTSSNMGFLTAGTAYQFNAFALNPVGGVGVWNVSDIRVRIIQMC